MFKKTHLILQFEISNYLKAKAYIMNELFHVYVVFQSFMILIYKPVFHSCFNVFEREILVEIINV